MKKLSFLALVVAVSGFSVFVVSCGKSPSKPEAVATPTPTPSSHIVYVTAIGTCSAPVSIGITLGGSNPNNGYVTFSPPSFSYQSSPCTVQEGDAVESIIYKTAGLSGTAAIYVDGNVWQSVSTPNLAGNIDAYGNP